MSPIAIALCLWASDASAVSALPAGEESWTVEVDAGRFERHDAVVTWSRPGPPAAEVWRVEGAEGTPLGFARTELEDHRGSRIRWVLPGTLRAGEVRRCRLKPLTRAVVPKGWSTHRISVGHSTSFVPAVSSGIQTRYFDDPVLLYHPDRTAPPEGVDLIYSRSGFIHPLWTPRGRVVTGDSPPAHRHQRGIFSAWTKTTFEGRSVDFWNIAKREGTTEASMVRRLAVGPVMSGFESVHEHLDETDPAGARVAATESWSVLAFRAGGRNIVDVTTAQRADGESPLVVEEYTYGGFAWRGPKEWVPEACSFFTDTSEDRIEANDHRPRWVAATGVVDGADVTFAILSHPGNFRGPQPVRIHPEEPYFCFAPCELGAFEIGEVPMVSRYRVIAADGRLGRDVLSSLYDDYAEPAGVRVVR